jgi:hypothetical protein
MTVLGTISQLSAFLSSSIYIGPLRVIPPRVFLYERAGRPTNWADGLSAWDLLLADRFALVERTNAWLSRLGAGCQLVLTGLDFFVSYWSEGLVGHTFLSFIFTTPYP